MDVTVLPEHMITASSLHDDHGESFHTRARAPLIPSSPLPEAHLHLRAHAQRQVSIYPFIYLQVLRARLVP